MRSDPNLNPRLPHPVTGLRILGSMRTGERRDDPARTAHPCAERRRSWCGRGGFATSCRRRGSTARCPALRRPRGIMGAYGVPFGPVACMQATEWRCTTSAGRAKHAREENAVISYPEAFRRRFNIGVGVRHVIEVKLRTEFECILESEFELVEELKLGTRIRIRIGIWI